MTCPARRTVLKGAAAACGVGLLSACGGGDTSDGSAAPAASTGSDAGGSRASLAKVDDIPVGGAVSASAPDGTTLLLTRPTESEVLAFNAVCPHQGCTVAPDDGRLSCPCHGSRFELDGSVERGPARTGLKEFPVKVFDGQVLPA